MAEPGKAPVWGRTCLRCGGAMEEGFLLEVAQGMLGAADWVEGPPEKSVWTGIKMRGRRKLSLTAYRCTDCGALDLYAPGA